MQTVDPPTLAKCLVDWFATHQRNIPWRKDYSPYQIWISEIMLQQTQTERVIPFFLRWINRFPDVEAVARASVDELLTYWEGLGYYSRVRNIQRAARIILEVHRGKFPTSYQDILELPGIGRILPEP